MFSNLFCEIGLRKGDMCYLSLVASYAILSMVKMVKLQKQPFSFYMHYKFVHDMVSGWLPHGRGHHARALGIATLVVSHARALPCVADCDYPVLAATGSAAWSRCCCSHG